MTTNNYPSLTERTTHACLFHHCIQAYIRKGVLSAWHGGIVCVCGYFSHSTRTRQNGRRSLWLSFLWVTGIRRLWTALLDFLGIFPSTTGRFRLPRRRITGGLFHVWDGGVEPLCPALIMASLSNNNIIFENRCYMALLVYPSIVSTLRNVTCLFFFFFYTSLVDGWT